MVKRRLYQLAVIIASLFIIQGFSRSLVELWQQKQRLGKAKQDLLKLEQQEADLKKQLAYYQSDEYVEKIAREKLMLGKPDEEVIVLPEQKDNNPRPKADPSGLSPRDERPPLAEISTNDRPENLPNWKKWARLFGF